MSEGILPATANTNSNSGANLPRGLMSKSGLPFNPNQRLPSLRSSLSKPSLLFQSSASFTHNQITSLTSTITKSPIIGKRNYEVTNGPGESLMTTRRQTGEGKGYTNGVKQGKNGLDSWKGSTSSSTSTGRGGRRQNNKKPKKLIQLESTVFTGAARSPIKTISDSPKKSRSKKATITSVPPSIQEQSEDSIEPAYIEGKLYQDDFINRSGDEDDNSEHLPQGWESLSLPIVREPVTTLPSEHWLTPDPLRDKLILFQLPKILENKTNAKLGKLRIYESGKVELVNNIRDLTFEVTKAGQSEQIIRSLSSATTTKTTITPPASTSSGDDLKSESIKLDYVEPQLNREVVIYSGRNLISIGKLESDAAIVIPKLFNS